MDSPGYIKPTLQNFLLTDITAKELRAIADQLEVDYLGPAAFPGTFPVIGNIIFLINAGSPVTYLCHEAMEALTGKDSHPLQILYVKIHSEQTIEANLSPKGSHFADVNVLGMDFLAKNRVFPIPNWDQKSFILQ